MAPCTAGVKYMGGYLGGPASSAWIHQRLMDAVGQPVIELYDALLRLPYTQSSMFILRDCLIPRLTYVLCLIHPDLATQFCEHMDAR